MVDAVSAKSAPADFAARAVARCLALSSRPFVTFHDLSSGERIELSYKTFGNWLAKTGNLIQDEVAAAAGDRIALLSRPHWLTAVWAVAPLLTAAVVDPWGDPAAAHTVVADPDSLDEARACPGELFALSLLPLGRGFASVPAGFQDYAVQVRAHGDRFASFDPPTGDTPALVDGARTLTQRDLVAVAADRGLGEGDRLLVTAVGERFTAMELVDWLYAPLLAGASVVLVRGDDPAALDRIAAAERTTGRLSIG
jgi:uncharacterized protein (TIGR03089 family)